MQLSRHADYALRLLMFLGQAPEARSGRRISVADAALRLQVSWHHLRKIVNELSRLGYLNSVRGRGGGLRLAMPPAEIRVGEVIRKMEPTVEPARCLQPLCQMYPGCCLRAALVSAMNAFFDFLDRYTLADFLNGRADLTLLAASAGRRRQD
jgi:Rrf2 family transcriptional regulator, nitric oxide-sensitive transcriptional repressor